MLNGFFKIYQIIEDSGNENPMLETLRILDILSDGVVRRFDENYLSQEGVDIGELVTQRLKKVPLEYIIGHTTFMDLKFNCSPAALIPRHETELLARTAITFLSDRKKSKEPQTVVDMGTGSGNLAVSLAYHLPWVKVLASDISSEALSLARAHVEQYDLNDRVTLFCGNMFEPLADTGHNGSIDLIVCNPPYIPTSSLKKMAPEIITHEPVAAFDAGAYGINIFRRLIFDSPEFLKSGGRLIFEIGEGQEELVSRLLKRANYYEDIQSHKNDEGVVRVLSAATV